MLYISITAILDRASDADADEIRALARTLGVSADTPIEDLLATFLNDYLAEMVKERLRTGVSLNASIIVDENREVVFTDATFLATGIGKDAQGNTVFFTSAGPLTVID